MSNSRLHHPAKAELTVTLGPAGLASLGVRCQIRVALRDVSCENYLLVVVIFLVRCDRCARAKKTQQPPLQNFNRHPGVGGVQRPVNAGLTFGLVGRRALSLCAPQRLGSVPVRLGGRTLNLAVCAAGQAPLSCGLQLACALRFWMPPKKRLHRMVTTHGR